MSGKARVALKAIILMCYCFIADFKFIKEYKKFTGKYLKLHL